MCGATGSRDDRWGTIGLVRADRADVDGGRRRVGPAKRAIIDRLSRDQPSV